MTVLQKMAWFILGVCLLTVVAVIACYRITGSPARAAGGMGVLGLCGAQPLIGLRRKRRGEITMDERDHAIWQKAGKIAFGTLWVAVVAVVTAAAVANEKAAISVRALSDLLFCAMWLIMAVWSLSILWMCRSQSAR